MTDDCTINVDKQKERMDKKILKRNKSPKKNE